ncbi:hypothetical protein [Pandoraea sputorum]|uniref:hypothetical protein n=1 Tax=Pandoraea sputorum TaxID=93222 RepID=UPI001780DB05|nr:hypothetical protein [Pandoraea sputorum]
MAERFRPAVPDAFVLLVAPARLLLAQPGRLIDPAGAALRVRCGTRRTMSHDQS